MKKYGSPLKEFDHLRDPDQMKAEFQKHLPGFSEGQLIITECVIDCIGFRPYKEVPIRKKVFLKLRYKLEVMDCSNEKSGVQMIYAKIYVDGQSWEEFQSIQHDHLCSPFYGEAPVHLPELGMIVWAFPNDPGILHLPELIDPERVKKYLPYSFLPSGLDGPDDVSEIKLQVIRCHPESRCVIRYHLEWKGSETLQQFILIGKTFGDSRGRDIFQWMDSIWREDFGDADDLLVPRPISYNEQVKTIWQVEQPGVCPEKMIDRTNFKEICRSAAKGLAIIHKSNLSGPPKRLIHDDLEEIRRKAIKLMRGLPQFQAPIQSILCGLENQVSDMQPKVDRLIHGDFSIDQLLVFKEKVVFLDFDDFAIGDPVQDIANFFVVLLLRKLDPGFVSLILTSFLNSYRGQVSWGVPADCLRWHIQVQFIRKAYRHYVQQKTGFEAAIQEIVVLAQKDVILNAIGEE